MILTQATVATGHIRFFDHAACQCRCQDSRFTFCRNGNRPAFHPARALHDPEVFGFDFMAPWLGSGGLYRRVFSGDPGTLSQA